MFGIEEQGTGADEPGCELVLFGAPDDVPKYAWAGAKAIGDKMVWQGYMLPPFGWELDDSGVYRIFDHEDTLICCVPDEWKARLLVEVLNDHQERLQIERSWREKLNEAMKKMKGVLDESDG